MIDNRLAEQILIGVIAAEMSIDAARNIWVRDQNRKIPNDEDLYIIVGTVDSSFIASKSEMIERVTAGPDPVTQQIEVTSVQLRENIQIDVLSRSNSAIIRRWEVIAALRSIRSQQAQEANYFKIFPQPLTFVNSAIAEGGSQLNRFTLSFPCFVWYRKERVLTPDGDNYYDDFTTRVDDEKTIGTENGIFEFSISAEE